MKVKVWDLSVRLLHWGLGITIVVAWMAGESSLRLHQWAGYTALAIVMARCIRGTVGGGYARFGQFVRSPSVVWRYALSVVQHRDARHLGHNPLGGWMVCALLGCTVAVGLTGWLYTLDGFWGMAWLEWLHLALAWTLVGLIVVHVAGVVFTSWRHRENLVGSMMHGHKADAINPQEFAP